MAESDGSLSGEAGQGIALLDGQSPSSSWEPTPSALSEAELTSADIAAIPAVNAAFEKSGFFETDESTPEAPQRAATRRKASEAQETADELAGYPGAGEQDGVIEPEGKPPTSTQERLTSAQQPQQTPDSDKAVTEGEQSPTLNPLQLQAAKRAHIDPGALDRLIKADPEAAAKLCDGFIAQHNELSAQYGRLGASMQQQGGIPQQPQYAPQPVQQPQYAPAPPQMAPVSLDQVYGAQRAQELADQLGSRELLDQMVGPLLAPVQQLQLQNQQQFEQQQQAIRGMQMELMGNQTTNFFTTLAPEFTELYGRGGNVTAEQKQSRETLALMGDQIRNGARSQGIDMPVHESLEQANMQFAMPFVAEQQRKELTAKVERRSASRTFQPTQRGRMTRSAPAPRSDEAAMEAMNEHANTLGWKWQQ